MSSHPPQPRPPLILGSASARRRELLSSAGVRFDVLPSAITETRLPGEAPLHFVSRMAREKAEDVAGTSAAKGDRRPVLGADTVVVLEREILGKPENAAHARQMLTALSGQTHRVLTGFCLHTSGSAEHQAASTEVHVVSTEVTFSPLTTDEIDRYLALADWQDKAGAYAVQEHAAYMVRDVRGSYTNVVGLPLAETVACLRQAGVID